MEPSSTRAIGLQFTWDGDVDAQKRVNFYMKALAKFASSHDMKLTLRVEISGKLDISPQKIEEMKAALRELGLNDDVMINADLRRLKGQKSALSALICTQ